MPYSSSTIPINVSSELVWMFLLDKNWNPTHYLKYVDLALVTEISDNELARTLYTEGNCIREKVEINDMTQEMITYLVDHPRYSGTTLYRVIESSEGVSLTLTLDWKDLDERQEDSSSQFDRLVKDTLISIRNALESDSLN